MAGAGVAVRLAARPAPLYIPAMMFVIGLIVWLVLGLAGGLATLLFFRGPTTTGVLSLAFGIFGAFIGGMLGVAPYVAHDPAPLRVGGVIGAVIGAALFPFVYHLVARKAL